MAVSAVPVIPPVVSRIFHVSPIVGVNEFKVEMFSVPPVRIAEPSARLTRSLCVAEARSTLKVPPAMDRFNADAAEPSVRVPAWRLPEASPGESVPPAPIVSVPLVPVKRPVPAFNCEVVLPRMTTPVPETPVIFWVKPEPSLKTAPESTTTVVVAGRALVTPVASSPFATTVEPE